MLPSSSDGSAQLYSILMLSYFSHNIVLKFEIFDLIMVSAPANISGGGECSAVASAVLLSKDPRIKWSTAFVSCRSVDVFG